MEVIFNNLQDNIVYHSNIFNYDKQFLMNLLKFNIKLDFSDYAQVKNTQDIPNIMKFLKSPSKEQVELMTFAVDNEYNRIPEDSEDDNIKKKNSRIKTSN